MWRPIRTRTVAGLGPGVGGQRPLGLDRGGDRGAGLAEGREHRVALGPDGDATVGFDGVADDRPDAWR